MVKYIRSDLDFILEQIKIAEAHAAGQPLFGPGGLVPAYNLSMGLRTVDGTYNNLLHPEWGAADNEFPEHLGTNFRPADGTPARHGWSWRPGSHPNPAELQPVGKSELHRRRSHLSAPSPTCSSIRPSAIHRPF